jgi:ABC-type transport system involved in multi-copper enzyme maturation permease subunit
MAVYKRTYKAYRGALTPAWSRFTVLSRYGFATLFDSRAFTAFTVICMIPFLAGLVLIYVVHNPTARALLNIGKIPLITNSWFLAFLGFEGWMGFLLTAWAGPGMVSKDFANQSIQLYLSRPISRAEYLLGKVSVLGGLLSCTTWIPALILFIVQAQLEGHGWGWNNLWMAGSIIVAGLLWISLISLLVMALSVWVRWRIASTGLMIGIFFFLPAFGKIFDFIMSSNLGNLISFPYLITEVWANLFRVSESQRHLARLDLVPLWSAWASLLTVCGISLWLLNTKLKAREVVRS